MIELAGEELVVAVHALVGGCGHECSCCVSALVLAGVAHKPPVEKLIAQLKPVTSCRAVSKRSVPAKPTVTRACAIRADSLAYPPPAAPLAELATLLSA